MTLIFNPFRKYRGISPFPAPSEKSNLLPSGVHETRLSLVSREIEPRHPRYSNLVVNSPGQLASF